VRRGEVKYKNPAKGRLFSAGFIEADSAIKAKKELSERGRTLVDVKVKILDEGKNITLECTFTWFIAKT
ncbi:MAG: thioesterase, partial [Nitrospirota bacterium]|nr:thioesterase [Nitrospirota bacterium]